MDESAAGGSVGDDLTILHPDGAPFLSFQEIGEKCDRAERGREQAERDLQLANWEKDKALAELAQLRARLAALEKS